MDQYNKQASEFIFRENNAVGRVASDTIDLHGQFVQEAEDILEQRIKYAQSTGQTHLHVIVGKGNHSANHIQKLKPRVEQVCRELGLQYSTEHNAGRIYVNLQGGPAQMPPHLIHDPGAYEEHHPAQDQHHGQQHYAQQHNNQQQQQPWSQPQYPGVGGYPNQQHHHQQNQQNEEIEAAVKKYLPRVLRKLQRSCCTVM
ncbi:MAG: hypothetical protein Q9214_000701 [Letrouitia sp. 1 TL-2023]